MNEENIFPEKKLGFGLMRLPEKNLNNSTGIDIDLCCKMADTFIEHGFTYFDTAWMYMAFKSENAVKDFLTSRHKRETFTLATKLHANFIKTKEDCDKIFNTQLEKTGAKYFDYYLIHDVGVDHYKIYKELECFEWLLEKKRQGLVKHVGFSFHDRADVLENVLNEHPEIEFVQLQINYLDWENKGIQSRLCYECACRHNVPVVVMEPVKGGTLANVPEQVSSIFKNANPNVSVPSWAIRFAASLDNVKMVLSGMSNMEQLKDNISTMENFKPLSKDEYKVIELAVNAINGKIAIPCTGCSYCTDGCPMQIPIPKYFSLYNADVIERAANPRDWTSQSEYYDRLTQNSSAASDCIECGQCENSCPQHLPIIQHLKDVSKKFGK